MAVAAGVLSETQRRTLEVCDGFAPSIEVATRGRCSASCGGATTSAATPSTRAG